MVQAFAVACRQFQSPGTREAGEQFLLRFRQSPNASVSAKVLPIEPEGLRARRDRTRGIERDV